MKTILCNGKFLALIREGHWEYAHRTNATGACVFASLRRIPFRTPGCMGFVCRETAANGTEKFVETLALTLALSPEEREQRPPGSGSADDRPAFPVARIRARRRTILLLLGEKAGMREVVHQIFRSSFQRKVAKTPRRKEKACLPCVFAPLCLGVRFLTSGF